MLSREYAHVINRHALMKHRSDRATGNLLAASGLALSGVKGGGNAKLMLQVASITSMGGYAHALETRADRDGLAMMNRRGYALEEAPKLFEITIAYLEEVKRQQTASPLAFAMSQPIHVTQRIAEYRKLISAEYPEAANDPDRVLDTDVFRRHVRGATVHQAGLELDRGRFDSAAVTIERALAVDDADPQAWVILGEARERSKTRSDLDGAIDAYERALRVDPRYAPAHRALGLLFYRDGRGAGALGDRTDSAAHHLGLYLDAAPQARDAAYVRSYLAELEERSGGAPTSANPGAKR